MRRSTIPATLLSLLLALPAAAAQPDTLPGTKPLTTEGDLAAQMVAGADKFLLRKIDESVEKRAAHWQRDFSSPEAYNKSIEPNRRRLAKMLGVVDERVKFDAPELIATSKQPALIATADSFDVYAVRWPVLASPQPASADLVSIHGEGLLLVPKGRQPVADIIALPDADQTPEQLVGLADGIAAESQFARQLAESGCRVIVPTLISREYKARNGRAKMTSREYIYRSSFELGRHIIGYEMQKVLACVDWLSRQAADEKRDAKIGVIGYGEGGMLSLYAAALDTRIDATCVSGYLRSIANPFYRAPLDRNLFDFWKEFDDEYLTAMIAPRSIINDAGRGVELKLPSEGGALRGWWFPVHSGGCLSTKGSSLAFDRWRRSSDSKSGMF